MTDKLENIEKRLSEVEQLIQQKHLPGQHDQASHGRGGSGKTRAALAASGESSTAWTPDVQKRVDAADVGSEVFYGPMDKAYEVQHEAENYRLGSQFAVERGMDKVDAQGRTVGKMGHVRMVQRGQHSGPEATRRAEALKVGTSALSGIAQNAAIKGNPAMRMVDDRTLEAPGNAVKELNHQLQQQGWTLVDDYEDSSWLTNGEGNIATTYIGGKSNKTVANAKEVGKDKNLAMLFTRR